MIIKEVNNISFQMEIRKTLTYKQIKFFEIRIKASSVLKVIQQTTSFYFLIQDVW